MNNKMTFEQEQKIALRIESLEQVALSNIQLIPEVHHILNEVPIRPEKTKAGSLERLERALDEGKKIAKLSDTLSWLCSYSGNIFERS